VISILPIYLIGIALGLVYLAGTITFLYRKWSGKYYFSKFPQFVMAGLVLCYGWASARNIVEALIQRPDQWHEISRLLETNAQPGDAVILFPSTILTVPPKELLNYYFNPDPTEIYIAQVETVDEIENILAQHKNIWLVMERRVDRNLITGIIKWLPEQPHIQLAIDNKNSVVFISKGKSQFELLEIVSQFNFYIAEPLGSLANIYASLNMWGESIENYKAAIGMSPKDGIWHYHLGVVYESIGSSALAQQEYETAIALEPNISGFYAALGDYYRRRNQTKQAIFYYEEAINIWVSQFIHRETSPIVSTWQNQILELEQSGSQ